MRRKQLFVAEVHNLLYNVYIGFTTPKKEKWARNRLPLRV